MRGDWGVAMTCITNTRTESKMHQEYNSMVLAINRWVHLGQQVSSLWSTATGLPEPGWQCSHIRSSAVDTCPMCHHKCMTQQCRLGWVRVETY